MWHHMPPDSSLPVIFRSYQFLLDQEKARWPVPIYIEEGPADGFVSNNKHSDLLYYLMLLHSKEEGETDFLKTMFSAYSSTDDPLDYHMIWHHRGILEAVGAFTSDDLHTLNMRFVAQLLSQGLCHWAIYVVLHIPFREDHPYLHVVRKLCIDSVKLGVLWNYNGNLSRTWVSLLNGCTKLWQFITITMEIS